MREPTPWSIAEAPRARPSRDGATAVVGELLARRSRAPQPEAWISQPSPDALWARAAEIDAALARRRRPPARGRAVRGEGQHRRRRRGDHRRVRRVRLRPASARRRWSSSSSPRARSSRARPTSTSSPPGSSAPGRRATARAATRSIPTLIAGGSSSGSAIVVATGEVSFALGTDTAGSGPGPRRALRHRRRQAHAGRAVERRRRAGDAVVRLRVGVHRGPRPTPHACTTSGRCPARRYSATTRRASACPTPIDWHGDDDARACFERRRRSSSSTLGCAVEDVDAAPMYDAGALLYGSALVAERFAAFGAFALAHRDAIDPAVLDIVRRGARVPRVGVRERRAMRCGRSATPAARSVVVDRRRARRPHRGARRRRSPSRSRTPSGPSLELGRLTAFVNPLGLAAVAAPTGRRASGLPFGVSLVGPGGTDHATARRWRRV